MRPDGQLDLLLANVPSPNGVALSPDGKLLYLAVTRGNCVWRVPLLTDGSVAKVSQFFTSYGPSGPDGLAVDAHDVPDPLPEPLRTGVYRLIEHVIRSSPAGARVSLHGSGDGLEIVIDAEVTDSEAVAAARARVSTTPTGSAPPTSTCTGSRASRCRTWSWASG